MALLLLNAFAKEYPKLHKAQHINGINIIFKEFSFKFEKTLKNAIQIVKFFNFIYIILY